MPTELKPLVVRMTDREVNLYTAYLKAAKRVLEFGCGGSTKLAIDSGVEQLWSVESDPAWAKLILENDTIERAVNSEKLFLFTPELGEIGRWGTPVDEALKHIWHSYHCDVWRKLAASEIDLVFVDGRFRVACILQTLLRTSPECVVIVHDFWSRRHFHGILSFVEVIDRTDDLAVFRRKAEACFTEMLDLLFMHLNDRS